MIGGKECDIKLAHPQRNNHNQNHHNGGGFGSSGGLRRNGGSGSGIPANFGFKSNHRNISSGGAGNWRSLSDRSNGGGIGGVGSGGGFRGGSGDDHHRTGGVSSHFPDTQFLTNVDTIPNNGGYGYKNYSNSNFFPNYWN